MDAITTYDRIQAQFIGELTNNIVRYKGYIIEPAYGGGFDFYPESEGRNDDCDLVGESYKRCGNVGFARTIEEAKDGINDRIMEKLSSHIVKTDFGMREYSFPWLEDAVGFASMWGGDLYPYGKRLQNP